MTVFINKLLNDYLFASQQLFNVSFLKKENILIIILFLIYNNYLFMTMYKRYKDRYTFQERVNKVKAFKETDQDKVMIIVEKHPKSKLQDLANSKFLTLKKFKFIQLKNIIQKKIKQKLGSQLQGKQSYFLYVSGKTPVNDQTIQTIYDRCKEPDGILYIIYQQQQSF